MAKGKGLLGLTAATTEKITSTGKDLFLSVGLGFIGAGAGAAIGRYSVLTSLPLLVYGAYAKSLPAMSAGIGMAYSNVNKGTGASATNGIGGIKEFSEGAKDRVKIYFDNFKDKLFIPSKDKAPVGALGNTSSYFTNPYARGVGELDLSQLDKIQNQISQLTGTDQELDDIEREF